MQQKPFRVAAVQASPVFLDRAATVEKACDLIRTAGKAGARLVVFPETFIPAYPVWTWMVPAQENRIMADLYAVLVDQSLTVPDDSTEKLGRAAAAAGAYVAIGINERNAEASDTTLYNSLIYFDDSGKLIGKHRKLVPTAGERLVHAAGAGDTLEVIPTPLGRIGGLICWENYMPLARYALYAWGAQIILSPTWDEGEPWLSTIRHIAKEGRAYVVAPGIAMRGADIPDTFEFKKKFFNKQEEWFKKGDSSIVNPDGKIIAGPVREKEEILYAEIDPRETLGSRWKLDVAGHYARPDVFELIVHKRSSPMVSQSSGDEPKQDSKKAAKSRSSRA